MDTQTTESSAPQTTTTEEEPMLGLTAKAAEKVREIQSAENIEATYGLRLRVVGGGCSGFAYDLYFDQLTEMDRTFDSHGGPRIVWVEPWAEDFTLLPGEEVEIIARNDSEQPWFFLIEWPESTQIYLEASSDFEVLQNGNRLECGHNRKVARDAGLQL